MKFEYTGNADYLIPKAIFALRQLEGIELFHAEQDIRHRHPLEIYSTTFSAAINDTIRLIDALQILSADLPHLSNKNLGWEKNLATITDNWLDSIFQHIDSCKSVISCFFSKNQEKKRDKCIRLFKKEIKQYREEVAKIVNLIKHNQRFIRIIYFHWVGGFVLGYFVEGVVENGTLGPDPLIHEKSNSAFSYNCTIPMHLCNIFFISSALAQTVYSITNKKIHFNNEQKCTLSCDLNDAMKKVSLLPLLFFPDEVKKPVPVC